MRFGSLFSGIGGLDLGFERAGMECAWQVEINDFCQRVLMKHWPNVPKYKDVRDVGKHNLEAVDVIVGGFPCQPHSLAGKRRGKADDRNLWPEYLRVVDELRPGYVVGENVPGLITTMLDDVLADLEGIGYTARPFIVPACAFGAPHRRDRIFIVAYSESGARRVSVSAGEQEEKLYIGRHHADASDPNGAKRRAISKGRNEPHGSDAGWKEAASGSSVRRSYDCLGSMAYAVGARLEGGERPESLQAGEKVAHGPTAECDRNPRWQENWLEVATRLCRMDDGVPRRMDRLRALGNAVVPQVAEWIARRIVEVAGAQG